MDTPTKIQQQDIFNRTFRMISRQGVGSISEGGTCLYRGPNGTACAAGKWLSDADMERVKEGFPVAEIVQHLPPEHPIVKHQFLFSALQNAHDRAALREARDRHSNAPVSFMEVYKERMDLVAQRFGLTFNPAA